MGRISKEELKTNDLIVNLYEEFFEEPPKNYKQLYNLKDYFGKDRLITVLMYVNERKKINPELHYYKEERAKALGTKKPLNFLFWWCKHYNPSIAIESLENLKLAKDKYLELKMKSKGPND